MGKPGPDRCCVQGLGLKKIPKGQGAIRRHSVGANTVSRTRNRDAWKRRKRVQRESQVSIDAASNGLALCRSQRDKALSVDIPLERTP